MSEDALLFGETAVARGFITQDQLAAALERQRESGGDALLGQVLVAMGHLTGPQASALEKLHAILLRRREQGPPAEDDDEVDLAGLTLGGCLLLEKLSTGSMGTAYVAHHLRLDRDVVVKVLHQRLVDIPGNIERFAREARAAANLEHPAIVTVYDFDSDREHHFIVMQYVKGQDLRQVLEQRGALGPRRALWIAARVLEGLSHAHARGIVHRDIKPANLLITPEPRIKIADFGLVRILSRPTGEDVSVFGEIIGTPQYMSPEQACGDDFDHRADLYSLGITLFELVAGRPPFVGNSTLEVLEKHIVEPLPNIRDLVSDAPADLDELLQRLCAKKMEDRFETADAAIAALQRLRFRSGATTRRLGPVVVDDPSRQVDSPPIVSEAALNKLKARLRRSRTFVAIELDEDDVPVETAEPAPDPAASSSGDELIDASFAGLEVDRSAFERARRRLEEAALNPDRAVPELMVDMLQEGQIDELLALEKRLDALLPTSPAVAFFLGRAYERKERLEDARGRYAMATVFAPDHLPARLHLARILVALGRVDEAVQALREACGWHPTSLKAWIRLGEVLYVVKNSAAEAVPAYERAIELAPTKWQLRQQLAWILYELGRYAQAEEVLKEVVAWRQDAAPAKELLAAIKKKRTKVQETALAAAHEPGDADEAETETGRSGPGPRTSAALDAIRLASASGKWERALEIAREGLKDKPRSLPLLLQLARAQVALGQLSDAVETYGNALALAPDDAEAQRGLLETQTARRSSRKLKKKDL